ncbi:hypothetical protein N9298_01305 [bacterium]|nr:hypothetical protein [bacterium]
MRQEVPQRKLLRIHQRAKHALQVDDVLRHPSHSGNPDYDTLILDSLRIEKAQTAKEVKQDT